MFITKAEFKELDIKEVFNSGKNFIKITDGRHSIYKVNGSYVVIEKDNLHPTNRIPKYIKIKLA